MTDKPLVTDMLALYEKDAEAFWLEVRRVVMPKPRHHNANEQRQYCTRCGKSFFRNPARMYVSDCPVPPPLDCSPAELAFRMRDKALLEDIYRVIAPLRKALGEQDRGHHPFEDWHWYAFEAQPHEQIAVCLVALGKWRMP